MNLGNVVEFIDSQKIVCAVILEIRKTRLRLLTENNREVKLSAGRLSHTSSLRLDTSLGRDKLVKELKAIAARRRELAKQIEVKELWEVLNPEQEWIDLKTMAALCFPEDAGDDQESAVIRAFFANRLYFRFATDRFFPYSPEQFRKLERQRREEAKKAALIEQGGRWMRAVLGGKTASRPENAETLISILAGYYLHEKNSPQPETARQILKNAGGKGPEAIFDFLVAVGHWQADENLDLHRYQTPTDFPSRVVAQTNALAATAGRPDWSHRQDLTGLPLITIDGQATTDFDDAISIVKDGDCYLLGVHITDVAHYVRLDDPIDHQAMERASSIYMPDAKIPMLPSGLSEDLCSLKQGQIRPAISFLIKVTAAGEILECRIVASIVRIGRQLTYQEADELVASEPEMAALYTIARHYRQHRLARGAVQITLPEINIRLDANGQPLVTRTDRESPARMLVAEIMIMANSLAAKALAASGLPAIFRSQAEPRKRLYQGDQGTLFQNWMQRKSLNRFLLSSRPEPHVGLGVEAYVTATSPIRKYTDLVTQRQLRAMLGLEPPYDDNRINEIIQRLETPMSQVSQLQYRRHRYWLLKFLQQRTGTKQEALVLSKRRNGHTILLTQYLVECGLATGGGIQLRPEDLVQVTIQHVNPRQDVLTVYLG